MIKVIKADLVTVEADAIVNAANSRLEHSGGVAKALVSAGGKIIQDESNKIGFVPIGRVAVTTAGSLKAKAIIHVPTLDLDSGRKASIEDIREGVKVALDKASELRFKTVAFPLLGAGVVGLPEEQVLAAIISVAIDYVYLDVILCIKR